jgi:transcriptional regulator with XRE-family HTH domain
MATAVSTQAKLIDSLISAQHLKNDAALSRALGVAPPVISKLRNGRLPIGPTLLIKIHDAFDMPIKAIRALYLPTQEDGNA